MNYIIRDIGCLCASCYQYDFIEDPKYYQNISYMKIFNKYYTTKIFNKYYTTNNDKEGNIILLYEIGGIIDNKFIISKKRLEEENEINREKYSHSCGGDDGW